MTAPVSHIHQLGEESSVWFQLTPLLKAPDNPLTILMKMAERYGGVIPVNLANQRIVLLTDPEHFKRVLVTKADDYLKYFDGLKHGYLRCEIGKDTWRTDVRVVDTIAVRDTPTHTAVTFHVESGHPVIVPG